MLRNYLKIAWRNIYRNKFYSGISIFGLSVGIAFTLLIAAHVWGELQVNKNLKHADRQYIIQSKWKDKNQGSDMTTLGPLAKALKDNFPGLVANYYRWDGISSNVSKNNKSFREEIAICDSTMLAMYGFNLLHGYAANTLKEPFTVVITKEKAVKFFDKTDVVGETITIENFSGSKHDFLITGVLDNIPRNSVTGLISNAPNDFFVSVDNLDFFGRNMNWPNKHIVGFIELQNGVTPQELEKPMQQLMEHNAPPQFTAELKSYLTPLPEYYLGVNNSLVKKMLYALSAIALFLLAMAIINFINMSVSRSPARLKETGLRKVMGGSKKQLIFQFLVESVIIVFFATVLAFLLSWWLKNLFESLMGGELPSLHSFPVYFICYPVLFILLVGFIAGIYPAFVLSSLKPVESLKGKIASVKDHIVMRKSLIAFQFITAIVAFIGAIVISKQIQFSLNGSLGYNKEYIISAQLPRNWTRAGVDRMLTIRDLFAAMPQVKDAALSFEIPDGNYSNDIPLFKYGRDSTQAITAAILESDEKFLSVYQIPLTAGSAFRGYRSDSLQVMLNETAVKALGFQDAQQAIGQQVKIPGNPEVYTVKAVINDFHFATMQTKIAPVIMFNLQYDFIYRYMSFKLNPGNIQSDINALQKKWASLMPGAPFEYKFMDDTLANLYKTEVQLKKASYTATALALIIVLVGVVGLISLNIQKRTKEIGIRKILGSSVAGILILFIKEFLVVILIGAIVACPVAYIIMHKWLQDYAYRVDITVQPFIISIISLGLITALLICIQTIKAAMVNPVKSLRAE